MKEPRRLLSEGATDFERQLLRAVANERPSVLLRSRMQRALGLSGPLLWASNVKAMFTTKAGAVGAVVGGVVVAGGLFAALSWAPLQGQSGSLEQLVQSTPNAPAADSRTVPVVPEAPVPSEPSDRVTDDTTASSEALGAPDNHLREEIALLDGARSALQQGARQQARAALKVYAQRFPDGALRHEAALLRRRAAPRLDQLPGSASEPR